MKAYKLLRKLSDGKLYPLFIHKTFSTPFGVRVTLGRLLTEPEKAEMKKCKNILG